MVRDFFCSFNIFSEQEIESLLPLFESRKMEKNEIFIREGNKCREIAFIVSGIFRSYYISEEGKDMTYCFRFPNDLMASYSSFIADIPSMETMQAISDADLLILRKDKIEELAQDNLNWIKFLKIIAEQEYLDLEKRFFQFQRDHAVQRYSALLSTKPEYVQNIPLQYLASYLGITQRHLSRIRKDIAF